MGTEVVKPWWRRHDRSRASMQEVRKLLQRRVRVHDCDKKWIARGELLLPHAGEQVIEVAPALRWRSAGTVTGRGEGTAHVRKPARVVRCLRRAREVSGPARIGSVPGVCGKRHSMLIHVPLAMPFHPERRQFPLKHTPTARIRCHCVTWPPTGTGSSMTSESRLQAKPSK